MWKLESPEVKKLWKTKSDEVKAEHAKKHPGYTYQPRKPSELKRRVTKRKLAEMVAVQDENEATIYSESSATPDTASVDESSSPPNLGYVNDPTASANYFPFDIFSAPPAMPITTLPDAILMPNALQHADAFFPFEDPDSANDLTIDYQDANYNRKFDLPVHDTQVGRFATDLSAYNQVYGDHMPTVDSNAVIASSFSQAVINEEDADINFLSAWLNLEEAENSHHNESFTLVSTAIQPNTPANVSRTSQAIPVPDTFINAEVMHDFSIPMHLSPRQVAVQQIQDHQRMAAFRLRRDQLESNSSSPN
jgi:hypothetical protein